MVPARLSRAFWFARLSPCASLRHVDRSVVGHAATLPFDGSMADDDEMVWYFTFGGNMNRATLARREGISPVQSLPGTLEGYQLAFNTQGFEGCEPRFASVEPLEPERGVRVHGIAHRLRLRELKILDRYEGATGPPGSMIGYDRVLARFTPYASAAAEAPASSYEVHTYVATQAKLVEAAPPSRRYLD